MTQSFGPEQLKSLKLMKKKEKELTENGYSVARHILIDDYSTATGLDRFDESGFLEHLKKHDAEPDKIVLESAFTGACEELVSKITDKSIKKSLLNYYKTRKKWPCSLCVATWYLMRLGKLEYKEANLPSQKIISILPDRFKTPEAEAQDIIKATEYTGCLNDIEVVFFESAYSDYSDWSEFDPEEYASRNYLRRVLPEDRDIIKFVADFLKENCTVMTLSRVADVGAGPNLYPSLAIRPYIASSGTIELIDPVESNRNFLVNTINHIENWNEFERLLHKKNSALYNMPAKLPANTIVQDGNIYDLPKEAYDCILSFFVAESITDDFGEVQLAISSLKSSLKPGGLLITGHTLGSVGYFAGMLTNFPATPLNQRDIQGFYDDFDNVKIQTTSHNRNYAPRKGYKGMAVIGGIKPLK